MIPLLVITPGLQIWSDVNLALYPVSLIILYFFYKKRRQHPLSSRKPVLLVLFAFTVSSVAFLELPLLFKYPSQYPCWLYHWINLQVVILCLSVLLIRSWVLCFKFWMTMEQASFGTRTFRNTRDLTSGQQWIKRNYDRTRSAWFLQHRKYIDGPFLFGLGLIIHVPPAIWLLVQTVRNHNWRLKVTSPGCPAVLSALPDLVYVGVLAVVTVVLHWRTRHLQDGFHIQSELRYLLFVASFFLVLRVLFLMLRLHTHAHILVVTWFGTVFSLTIIYPLFITIYLAREQKQASKKNALAPTRMAVPTSTTTTTTTSITQVNTDPVITAVLASPIPENPYKRVFRALQENTTSSLISDAIQKQPNQSPYPGSNSNATEDDADDEDEGLELAPPAHLDTRSASTSPPLIPQRPASPSGTLLQELQNSMSSSPHGTSHLSPGTQTALHSTQADQGTSKTKGEVRILVPSRADRARTPRPTSTGIRGWLKRTFPRNTNNKTKPVAPRRERVARGTRPSPDTESDDLISVEKKSRSSINPPGHVSSRSTLVDAGHSYQPSQPYFFRSSSDQPSSPFQFHQPHANHTHLSSARTSTASSSPPGFQAPEQGANDNTGIGSGGSIGSSSGGSGFNGNGFNGSGFSGSGFNGSGFSGSGFNSSGFSGSGSSGSGSGSGFTFEMGRHHMDVREGPNSLDVQAALASGTLPRDLELSVLLENEAGFRAFESFLLKEFSVENLYFWHEVKWFRRWAAGDAIHLEDQSHGALSPPAATSTSSGTGSVYNFQLAVPDNYKGSVTFGGSGDSGLSPRARRSTEMSPTSAEIVKRATFLYQTFISETAPLQLNLPAYLVDRYDTIFSPYIPVETKRSALCEGFLRCLCKNYKGARVVPDNPGLRTRWTGVGPRSPSHSRRQSLASKRADSVPRRSSIASYMGARAHVGRKSNDHSKTIKKQRRLSSSAHSRNISAGAKVPPSPPKEKKNPLSSASIFSSGDHREHVRGRGRRGGKFGGRSLIPQASPSRSSLRMATALPAQEAASSDVPRPAPPGVSPASQSLISRLNHSPSGPHLALGPSRFSETSSSSAATSSPPKFPSVSPHESRRPSLDELALSIHVQNPGQNQTVMMGNGGNSGSGVGMHRVPSVSTNGMESIADEEVKLVRPRSFTLLAGNTDSRFETSSSACSSSSGAGSSNDGGTSAAFFSDPRSSSSVPTWSKSPSLSSQELLSAPGQPCISAPSALSSLRITLAPFSGPNNGGAGILITQTSGSQTTLSSSSSEYNGNVQSQTTAAAGSSLQSSSVGPTSSSSSLPSTVMIVPRKSSPRASMPSSPTLGPRMIRRVSSLEPLIPTSQSLILSPAHTQIAENLTHLAFPSAPSSTLKTIISPSPVSQPPVLSSASSPLGARVQLDSAGSGVASASSGEEKEGSRFVINGAVFDDAARVVYCLMKTDSFSRFLAQYRAQRPPGSSVVVEDPRQSTGTTGTTTLGRSPPSAGMTLQPSERMSTSGLLARGSVQSTSLSGRGSHINADLSKRRRDQNTRAAGNTEEQAGSTKLDGTAGGTQRAEFQPNNVQRDSVVRPQPREPQLQLQVYEEKDRVSSISQVASAQSSDVDSKEAPRVNNSSMNNASASSAPQDA